MSARRFPVLNQQDCRPQLRKTMPRSIPWAFAETFREQAYENHSQTLERLAERGGLSPEEIWMAANAKSLRMWREVDEQASIDWLYAKLAEIGDTVTESA